jgi:hypothetical protein
MPDRIDEYLTVCRSQSVMEEIHQFKPEKPPSADELRALIAYLTKNGLRPVVAGSASAFHHLALAFGSSGGGKSLANLWRPTKDVDLWVTGTKRLPVPPTGWSRDPEAVGTDSWISPSGGVVDFIIGGTPFPSGVTAQHDVTISGNSLPGIPVADIFWIIRSKLGTSRMKDLSDIIDLLHAIKANPKYAAELPAFRSALSSDEREELDSAQVFVDLKRTGNLTLPDTEALSTSKA